VRLQATEEGLVPLKNWVKSALDRVIQECMGEPGLEFVWVGDDAVDPLRQAQTLNILVSAGIGDETRAELGLGQGWKLRVRLTHREESRPTKIRQFQDNHGAGCTGGSSSASSWKTLKKLISLSLPSRFQRLCLGEANEDSGCISRGRGPSSSTPPNR
jgi:hypothetical protein